MGDTNRVNCTQCGTSYDRRFLLGKQGALNVCPMCGAFISLSSDEEDPSAHDDEPSFEEDVVFGENDSFDEDKIDFWWYEMREPKTLDETDTGDVGTTCAKCGHLSFAPYPIARTGDYLLIDSRYTDTCSHCGNEMKNHILSKRPESWVDPRQHDMWVKDYEHLIKCPICSSTRVHKISMTNKAASIVAFGIFSAGHVSKTYKCDICGSKW